MDRPRCPRARWGPSLVVAFGTIFVGGGTLPAQGPSPGSYTPPGLPTEITQVRFNAGQSVVPYFEGWIKNPDGTFDMVFGYFNRNWKQEISVPVGPDNKVEPLLGTTGDLNQPTYFLPRRHRFIYRVRVPANFGKQSVIWTLTTNGRTERAYGELIPEQEINERVVMTNGSFDPGHDDPNKQPTLIVAATATAKVNVPLALRVQAADDGLPKPRSVPTPKPVATSGTTAPSQFTAQVNSSAPRRVLGLRVTWKQYRGPAKAVFLPEDLIAVSGTQGETETSVRFSEVGTYKILATATDGAMSRNQEVTVTVTR
ncbi:MAG: hypothetical protein FJW27_02405 [Acidimicrobiia bacterium]|nr:hypothetical protein [Acidimicrobiia bacterium]